MSRARTKVVVAVGLALLAAGAGALVGLAAPAGAQDSTDPAERGEVAVLVEFFDDYPFELRSANYVPLRVRLVDPDTGAPVEARYEVVASPRAPDGRAGAVFTFSYPYADAAQGDPGVYSGLVIVPFGDQWTFLVSVFDPFEAATTEVPVPLGTGQLTLSIEAPTLDSAAQLGQTRASPSADLSELAVLVLHGLAGLAWFGLAGLLILVVSPSRTRFLAPASIERLDRNIGRIAVALGWCTAVVWVSGILNLNDAAAYSFPLTPGELQERFRLPYGKPYTLALLIKIGVYVVLVVGTIPLVRAAYRRANEWHSDEAGADARVASGAGALASSRTMARAASGGWLLGGGIILVCVSVLRFTHILTEQVRAVP